MVSTTSVTDAVALGLDEVELRLREAVAHSDELADTVSRHLVEAGGKRVRPMLALLAAHLGDPTRPEVLDAAVVVELTHLATLYHDDVMDSAPTRRGAPSVHARTQSPISPIAASASGNTPAQIGKTCCMPAPT